MYSLEEIVEHSGFEHEHIVSGSQEVDLVSFISFSFSIFFSIYFPFVLFLACRARISDDIGHMTQRGF